MDKQEEKELVERARKDHQAFGQLYDKYYGPIYRYILHRVADGDLACDLTSETFFKALRNLKKFRWRGAPFSSWLYRIATNEINMHFRKRKLHRLVSLETFLPFLKAEPEANPETQLINKEEEYQQYQEFKRLHQAIMRLSLTEQTVIALRFFERKRVKEIAQILGLPEGTVKSHAYRGLKKLRRLLSECATKGKDEHCRK